MHTILSLFLQFWRKYPALLYGVSLLLCAALYFAPGWHLAIPFLLIFGALPFAAVLCQPLARRLFLAGVLFSVFYAYCVLYYPFLYIPESGLQGIAKLELESVEKQKTSFGYRLCYKARLISLQTSQGEIFYSISVSVRLPFKQESFHPYLEQCWLVSGRLHQMQDMQSFYFIPSAGAAWIPAGATLSTWVAAQRQNLKESISHYFSIHMDNSRSAPLLSGLITGQMDDTTIKHHFGRFGLQHILAISGFHFSLLASLFGFVLGLFLSGITRTITLISILTCYFLFLGASPSILRAWISICLTLTAPFLRRKSSGLNLLGVGLIFVLLYNPSYVLHIGFQFSFAITAAILLFSSPISAFLCYFLPTRRLSEAIQWDKSTQAAYILSTGIRETIALSAAVNIAAIPLMLLHFQSFPLFSLIYNLFFPFFAGIALLIGIIVSIVDFGFGFATPLLHNINSHFTYFIVGLAFDAPPILDIQVSFVMMDATLCTAIISVTFAFMALRNTFKGYSEANFSI